jgi:hypothetical protein
MGRTRSGESTKGPRDTALAQHKAQAKQDAQAAKAQATQDALAARAQAAQDVKAIRAQAAQDVKATKAQAKQDAQASKAKTKQDAQAARAQAAQDVKAANAQATQDAKAAKAQAADDAYYAKAQPAEDARATKAQAYNDARAAKAQATQDAKAANPRAKLATPGSTVVIYRIDSLPDSPIPRVELTITHRMSNSSNGLNNAATVAKGHQENQILAARILLRHPNVPITRINSVSRVRQSRDALYEDCGPNAGRICPIQGDQDLHDALDGCLARNNTAIIIQRGADCLTHVTSLLSFLAL